MEKYNFKLFGQVFQSESKKSTKYGTGHLYRFGGDKDGRNSGNRKNWERCLRLDSLLHFQKQN